jgi:hypothetical protein
MINHFERRINGDNRAPKGCEPPRQGSCPATRVEPFFASKLSRVQKRQHRNATADETPGSISRLPTVSKPTVEINGGMIPLGLVQHKEKPIIIEDKCEDRQKQASLPLSL